jgi:hypothetical protein
MGKENDKWQYDKPASHRDDSLFKNESYFVNFFLYRNIVHPSG